MHLAGFTKCKQNQTAGFGDKKTKHMKRK